MIAHLPSRKALAIAAASLLALVAAYLLLAWLALPPLLQSQAERYIAEKTGHRLSLDKPEFNPFEFSLRLRNLRLEEPDGKPLLAIGELLVDVSAASLVRRAYVFDAIRVDALAVTLVQHADGRLNWTALIEALKGKETATNEAPPRFDITRFVLADGRALVSDERTRPTFATRIEPLDLELTDLSTLPDETGRYRISARTSVGAKISWQGEARLNPLALSGAVAVEGIDLSRFETYLRGALPIAQPTGLASFSANYRLAYAGGRATLSLDGLVAKVAKLGVQGTIESKPVLAVDAIAATNGRFDLASLVLDFGAVTLGGTRLELPAGASPHSTPLTLDGISVENIHVDLAKRDATIARVALSKGSLTVRRTAQGHIDLVDAFAASARTGGGAAEPAGPGWHYRIAKAELEGFGAQFRDESVKPAAEAVLDDIAVSVTGISDDLAAPVPLWAAFTARSGGRCEAEGNVVPGAPSATMQLKLSDLALKPAEPYLAAVATLKLASGKLSTEGRASYDARGAAYRGGFALRDLRINQAGTNEMLLSWKALATRTLALTPVALEIGDLTLDGLDTQLIIDKDKTVNFSKVLRKPPTSAPPAAQGPASQKPTAPFAVNVDRLHITNSALDFADHSLALPFGTRIHDLKGIVTGLSSRPAAPGQVEVDGQVDDYGLARAVGQISLFDPTDYMDLRVVFRNVEMTRLTPYSATFAGRKIASGKLSLDLAYKIDKHQLHGDNQVIMDQLVLGERVESPEAKNLPLDLAIAVLQDSDGRIDLGLPVSGSLDDPQFSYGQIVWKAIANVLTKIVTAPFRALGALFGGGEKFENIAFEAGDAELTGPEREKLVQLAAALGKRPGLSLTVHGVFADADRVAMQDRQLRRAIVERMGQRVDAQGDPGPISTRQPKVQSALESLYAERFGGGELASLKEGFRRANPGQLEEGVAGKMLSRLSGLFREKRTLSDDEVSRLKGADFHAALFQRLRSKEAVGEDRLLALGRMRGETTMAALAAAGAPADRLNQLTPEKVTGEAQNVPLKLVLGSAKRSVAPPESSPAPQAVGQ